MKGLGSFFVAVALLIGVPCCFAIVVDGPGHGLRVIGVIVAFILGIVGLICHAAGKPDARAIEKQELRTGKAKKCPFCAETIKTEARVCRFCGRDVPSSQLTTVATETPITPPASVSEQPRGAAFATNTPLQHPSTDSAEVQQIFLWQDHQQVGPYTTGQLQTMFANGDILPDTLVWWAGVRNFLPLKDANLVSLKKRRLSFACPRCSEHMQADESQIGQSFGCLTCQFPLTVPRQANQGTGSWRDQFQRMNKRDKNALVILAVFLFILILAGLITSATVH